MWLHSDIRFHLPAVAGRNVDAEAGSIRRPTADMSELRLPDLGGDNSERWTRLALRSDDRTIYLAYAKTRVRPPLQLDPFPRMLALDRMQLIVHNASVSRSYVIKSVHAHVGAADVVVPGETTVLPMTSLPIEFTVPPLKPNDIVPARISVEVNDQRPLTTDATASYSTAPRRRIQVDGDLADWTGVPAMNLDEAPFRKLLAERSGKADLGGTVQLAWDGSNFYLAAAITDDTFDQTHHGYNTWKGDNLQLGISDLMPWTAGEWPRRWHEISLALTPSGPEVFASESPTGGRPIHSAKLVVRRTATTTFYECAIPWSEFSPLLPKAEALSLAVFVNDADGAGRRGYLQWGDIKSLSQLQQIRLVDPPTK